MIKEKHYNIINLNSTDSTNEYAKRLARESYIYGNDNKNIDMTIDKTTDRNIDDNIDGDIDKTVVIAESQSAGKGRLGRSFLSESGKGIFMSILLKPDISAEQASGLTLVAAVALYDAISDMCGLETGIKWPNDIVADGKKLCGILTEMSVDGTGVKFVVVGIGLNVSNDLFDAELSGLATSLYLLTGRIYDKNFLVEGILKSFDAYYEMYLKEGNLLFIKELYNKKLIHMGEVINAINGENVLQGVCKGINDKGHLLVENDGIIEEIISGEISVRGVYGYV